MKKPLSSESFKEQYSDGEVNPRIVLFQLGKVKSNRNDIDMSISKEKVKVKMSHYRFRSGKINTFVLDTKGFVLCTFASVLSCLKGLYRVYKSKNTAKLYVS